MARRVERLAIIGLGLIGSSIARAVKDRLPDVMVTGHDANSDVRDIARTFDTKNLTIDRNGQRIEGMQEDLTADTVLRAVFIFKGAARGWVAEQLT